MYSQADFKEPETDDFKYSGGNNDNDNDNSGSDNSQQQLSIRAEQVKNSLLATNGVVVNAILLSNSNGGKSSSIKYNTCSSLKEVNKIIGGRVSIIGELEDINAIVVCAIRSRNAINKRQSCISLPYPLSSLSSSISGDVLVFRCDANADFQDLSIDEYAKYCEINKELSVSQEKEDERAIHPSSIVPNESGYTIATLSIELAKQYISLDDAIHADASQSDIDKYVSSQIDAIISESIINDSPLNDPDYDVDDDESNDPDYNPNNEEDLKQKELDLEDENALDDNDIVSNIRSIYSRNNNGNEIDVHELELVVEEVCSINAIIDCELFDNDDLDESVWREELNNALNFVRAKGRHDGEQLVESINQTYYECNGDYPVKSTLFDIFQGIQLHLAQEAVSAENDDATYDDNDDDNDDDSDYDPNNSDDVIQRELDLKDEQEVDDCDDCDDLSDSDYRTELNEALNYVRAKGRYDGQKLAETVSSIYYYNHGVYPSQTVLREIFSDIQVQLEIENDMIQEDDDSDDDDVDIDDGTAYNYQKLNGIDDIQEADPTDLVEYSFRILSENMINQVVSSFNITKRREPTISELRQSIKKKTDDFSEKMVNFYLNNYLDLENDDDDCAIDDYSEEVVVYSEVVDADYDPTQEVDVDDNDDQVYLDAVDDVIDVALLQSPVRYSKLNGNGESYSIYFGSLPSKKEELQMLESAKKSFKMRNGRSPNSMEMRRLKATVCVADRDDVRALNQDDEKASELLGNYRSSPRNNNKNGNNNNNVSVQKTKLLVTPVKTKKNKSARYDILLDQESTIGSAKKEQTAIEWFERFNNRKPSKEEIENIRKFVETDSDNLKLEFFDVVAMDDDDDEKSITSKAKMRRVNVKANRATKYTLEVNDEQSGDVEQAVKWFSRFNSRKPTNDELKKIYAFTQNDSKDIDDLKDDTVDID